MADKETTASGGGTIGGGNLFVSEPPDPRGQKVTLVECAGGRREAETTEKVPLAEIAQDVSAAVGRKMRRATGWAFLDPKGRIIVNSVRDSPSGTRLAGGEGKVYPVTILLEQEDAGRE
jgi:hypothetical protein